MNYTLNAVKRTVKGEKVRDEGKVPAVVYGTDKEAVSVSIEPVAFDKLYESAGESSLIDLMLDGKNEGKVLIQEVQRFPLNDRVMHVDLRRIDMNKPMTAHVELNFIGEAPAVKVFGAILVKSLEEVEVECLPKDLVSHIDVDLSVLNAFGDHIKVGDLKLPQGIEVINPTADTALVSAAAPMSDEEIAALEASSASADINKIEVEKAKKAEEGEADEKKK